MNFSEEDKRRLREFVQSDGAYAVVDKLLDLIIERFRDTLETANEDARFYQGKLNGVRSVKAELMAFGAPLNEYMAQQEALEKFRGRSRNDVTAIY